MEAARHWSVRHAHALHRLYACLVRWIPAFSPILAWIGVARAKCICAPIESATKQFLFDCRMCGQCSPADTGMACPMNCAKQLRNGPCGGVRTDGGCVVKPAMRCVWMDVHDGRNNIGYSADGSQSSHLHPLDHRQQGTSTWVKVIHGNNKKLAPTPPSSTITHEPASFEQACRSGRFLVTVKVAPPDSADPRALIARAMHFKGLVDAINITDGAGGHCHISSVAASALLAEHGFTPIYQIACRDRNRIAIQGDIIGAAALGIRNILCLTGDDVSQGDQPEAKPVFDLDAVSLLQIARRMRDNAEFVSGRRLDTAPNLYIGATANPFVPPHLDRIANLEMKVASGAQFIQTQFCFDIELFRRFMKALLERDLHRRTRIIVGVGALGSAKALHWMANNVPGVHVPPGLVQRIAAADDQKAEGTRACLDMIRAVADIDGVAGVHLMGHRNEDALASIIVEAGFRTNPLTHAA